MPPLSIRRDYVGYVLLYGARSLAGTNPRVSPGSWINNNEQGSASTQHELESFEEVHKPPTNYLHKVIENFI
jgi:hypothetical protein